MTKLFRFALRLAGMFALALVLLAPRPLEAGSSKVSYQVLYSFQGPPDGTSPQAGLIRDAGGNLYGTTSAGGTGTCSNYNPGCGTVFSLDSNGQETVLYSFAGPPTDGDLPQAALVQDSSGNLYGTTSVGGTQNFGTVFKVDTNGTEVVLYNFCPGGYPCTDGKTPLGSLVLDANGGLYGTTFEGGSANYGTVFKVDSDGTETVLYSFTGGADGRHPQANLIFDAAGSLYGTTANGGTGCSGVGCGVVFKLDPSGTETVLYKFKNSPDGAGPLSGLIWDADGNLYGTTIAGGKKGRYCGGGCGTVFRLTSTGKETALYRFAGPSGGSGYWPTGALVRDSAGYLYGTAETSGGDGLAFKVSKTGRETVLYKFSNGKGGNGLAATLVRDPSGALYGTTDRGGSGYGVVFKLTP